MGWEVRDLNFSPLLPLNSHLTSDKSTNKAILQFSHI